MGLFKIKFSFMFLLLCLFQQNHTVYSDEIVDKITSYLLPHDHVIKKKLDMIFNDSAILNNRENLKKRGFKVSKTRKSTNLYIAKHTNLKGYIVKLYLNEQTFVDERLNFISRIEGANSIRQYIIKNGYESIFKIPNKWIYVLPNQKLSTDKKYILIVENMKLCDEETNYRKWKDTKITSKKTLTTLFNVLKNEGLIDSVYIDNIPYCRDGKIAFVDTEHVHRWPVNYGKFLRNLSSSSQKHWNTLMTAE